MRGEMIEFLNTPVSVWWAVGANVVVLLLLFAFRG